jgi:signal transduction histidine kinase
MHILPEKHSARESAEAIEQAGWRVQGAVQRLLDFSKPAPDTFERISVNQTIQIALALIGEHIQADGFKLVVDLPSDLPGIYGNARQLVDLWITLLMQVHGAPTNGEPRTIQISSRVVTGGVVQVELSDDRLLAPSAEPAASSHRLRWEKGIEFGLCQEIVSQHNGKIFTDRDGQRNLIFYVQFPISA